MIVHGYDSFPAGKECTAPNVIEWLQRVQDEHTTTYVWGEDGDILVRYSREETDDEIRRREGIASEIANLANDLMAEVKENKERDASIRVIQGEINRGNQKIAAIRKRLAELRM